MIMLKKSLAKAEFLDFVFNLEQQIINLGSVPHNKDVYEYALRFFSVLKKIEDKCNMENMFFLFEKENTSTAVYDLLMLKYWVRNNVGVNSNNKITLDNIFPLNGYISLKEYQEKDAQPLVQKEIHDCLVKKHKEILGSINMLRSEVKRPKNMILQFAEYKLQKNR